MAYELHTKFKAISTSDRARCPTDTDGNKIPLSVPKAVSKAKGNLLYITRDGVENSDLIFIENGAIDNNNPDKLKSMKSAIDERAKKHRKGGLGVRVADKLTISLPNDATPEEHREMAKKILKNLCGDSEAKALAAIHRDKKNNPHIHILFVDGLESVENAKQRKPDAKRVRRQDYGRMSDGGRPKELREQIANIINEVGQREGRNFAEHRSFEERGMSQKPQIHEGVEFSAKRARKDDASPKLIQRLDRNASIIAENVKKAEPAAPENWLHKLPNRWRKPEFLKIWLAKFGLKVRKKEPPQHIPQQIPTDLPIQSPHIDHTARKTGSEKPERPRPAYLGPKPAPRPTEMEKTKPKSAKKRSRGFER